MATNQTKPLPNKTPAPVQAARPLIGRRDNKVAAKKVDPLENMPTFAVSGKDAPEKKRYVMGIGETLAGRYVGTKLIKSDKLLNGESTLHVFRDADDQNFGIWGVSHLNFVCDRLRVGQYIELTYIGQEERETKWGMKPCHSFDVATENGEPLSAAIERELEEQEGSAANA